MFWNSEFLDSSPSHIDVLLQLPTVKLSDIIFEDDLLQELKTSNISLTTFLHKPEIIAELVDNITQLTEKDCCDKSLYSRVHAAYISCEILTAGVPEIFTALMSHPESLSKIISCLVKVIPQKAALVSKLISTIHQLAAASLSCHITQDVSSFARLINLLVDNIDDSGSFEILSTFIKRTSPTDLRYAFCEILSNLNFVFSLIDTMTLNDVEDKQRNACQLLCDIIVIGRQEAAEQTDSSPIAQDMLAELLESKQAVQVILDQMFSQTMKNSTATVCGIKVLQTLLEQKSTGDANSSAKAIEQTQEEIEKHLIKFHELLLNPPKQEPIKTTFGIIQKPLGYMRLEIVNLIRALISTNSPKIIRKLVELKTMKVIIDLFIEYSWNNLLHTQVEQALCLIINNYRRDDECEEKEETREAIEIPSRDLLSQLLNEIDVIGRLLIQGNSTNNEANFGHIIQMINSLAINRDLDTIRDHLNEMKDKRPELHERWTTFVDVDVASFKEISLFYDARSGSNNVSHRFGHPQQHWLSNTAKSDAAALSKLLADGIFANRDDDDEFTKTFDKALVEYKRETVIPAINADVLPRLRRRKSDFIASGYNL